MEIERIDTYEMTSIEDFAEKHGLTLVIEQYKYGEFRVYFKNIPMESYIFGRVLDYGYGKSEREAIFDYFKKIAGVKLIIPSGSIFKLNKVVKVPNEISRVLSKEQSEDLYWKR